MRGDESTKHRALRPVDLKYQKQFLKALSKRLPQEIAGIASLMQTLKREAKQQFYKDDLDYDDAATQGHHWAACLALTADEVLAARLPDAQARLMMIEAALLSPAARPIKFFTRLMLLFSLDRFRTLKTYAQQRVPAQYGPHFQFETLEDDDTTFVQGIPTCFFNSYFRAKGKDRLTSLFCAFDRLWIDEIKPQRDSVAFERPQTLAAGSDHCRFEFRKVTRT